MSDHKGQQVGINSMIENEVFVSTTLEYGHKRWLQIGACNVSMSTHWLSLDKYYSDVDGRVWDVGVTIRHQH